MLGSVSANDRDIIVEFARTCGPKQAVSVNSILVHLSVHSQRSKKIQILCSQSADTVIPSFRREARAAIFECYFLKAPRLEMEHITAHYCALKQTRHLRRVRFMLACYSVPIR